MKGWMMKKRASFWAAALAAALMAGCGGDAKPAGDADGDSAKPFKGEIGLSLLTLANPFFKDISKTMTKEAAKHGYKVITVSGDEDPAQQDRQVQDFIARGVSAIVLSPCNSDSVGSAIKQANKAGIPVFTVDIACNDETAKVVCHIATDNLRGGHEAAAAIIEGLDGKGKVAILDFDTIESCQKRKKGFLAEIKKRNESPDVNIEVVDILPGGGNSEQGYKAMQVLLTKHMDLAGVFAINDPSALGAVARLKEEGRLDEVVVVGFDGHLDGKLAILAGDIYADPIQFPDKIGAECVRVMMEYFDGKQPEPEFLIPTALYRKADAEKDPVLKKEPADD